MTTRLGIAFHRPLIWLWPLLAMAACARAQRPAQPPPSILQAPGDSIRLELVDAAMVQPIANAAIAVFSDNGIRCIKAPCPTNGKSWEGSTDARGRLLIPKSVLNTTAKLKSAAYYGDLIEDVTLSPGGVWRVEFFPAESAEPAPHPLKLVDARTLKPLANATVRIESRNPGAKIEGASVQTNALGYLFIPLALFATSPESASLVASGYRDMHIDYAYARRKMLLERM